MNNNILKTKRQSITIFFCDVYGTIDGGCSEEECKRFAELLEELKEKDNSDLLLFGMLSTEHPDVAKTYEQKISKYFANGIVVIDKHEDAEVLREAKVSCAIYYIDYLKQYYDINSVFCADDVIFIQEMFSDLLKSREGITLNSIIPGKEENNLTFINSELENKYIRTDSPKR
mgnify:CR=1 FL=1